MNVKDEIHWRVTAQPEPEYSTFEGETSVDVLVVGGGLTGCRAALDLADAGTSVAIADAKEIGFGASGRSGGQCNPIWRQTPAQLIEKFGQTHGENLINATLTAADDLFSDIRKFDVDCDPVQNGWIQAAHTKKTATNLRALGKAWSDAGADITELEGQDVENASGSPAYSFALRHAKGGNVHPLSLTRGYAKAAKARGAQLLKDTPITKLERVNGKWRASAPSGTIIAENVVLTTNAYSDSLWPKLKRTFQPLVSVILATAPLSAEHRAQILPNGITISDTRLAIFYSRWDRDGRLIFGCVGSDENVDTLGGFRRLKRGLGIVFPQIVSAPIERKWAGRIAVTPGMMPHLHEPAPGVIAGLGFSGRGIAMTSVMGRTLAAKVMGTSDSKLAFPVSPIIPLPFHSFTSQFVPLVAPAMTVKDKLGVVLDGLRA